MTMIKDKKLTIKFFLNKRLKPRIWKNEVYYPLYVSIIYDKKNTSFKYKDLWRNLGLWFKEEKDIEKKDKEILEMYEFVVRSIINFELDLYGDKFKLNRIGKKIFLYGVSLTEVFSVVANSHLHAILGEHLDINKFDQVLHDHENDISCKLTVFEEITGKKAVLIVPTELKQFIALNALLEDYQTQQEGKYRISPYSWLIEKVVQKHFKSFLETIKSTNRENDTLVTFYEDIMVDPDNIYIDGIMKDIEDFAKLMIEGRFNIEYPNIDRIELINGKSRIILN